MDLQALTLHLPETTYQRLVELAEKSERPVADETLHLLNSALTTNVKVAEDINDQLEQLSLLTDEELWKAAQSVVSDEDNDLIQALLEKRQREGITPNEATQLQALSNHCNQIMLVRAKAAAILSEREYDISSLAPSA